MSSTQNGALNMPTNSNVMSRRNVNNRERQNQLMRRRIINKLQQKCSQLNNTPIDNQDMLDPNSSMDFHFKLVMEIFSTYFRVINRWFCGFINRFSTIFFFYVKDR
ncbi:unnamed protein product [Rhizophagus irregularis]|nr:unnamed protein product [Rhizophagus irregularis]